MRLGSSRRAPTLIEHQQIACEALGFRWLTDHQQCALVRVLRGELSRTDDRERLLGFARRCLYDHRLIIVHERRLRSMCAAARRQHEAELSRRIALSISPSLLSRWRAVLTAADRERASCAFELATLFGLRRALRNGTVWIEHSLTFRSRERLFLPAQRWQLRWRAHYRRLGLPTSPDAFLEPLRERAAAGVRAVAEAATDGRVTVDTALHLAPIVAEPEDPQLAKLRALLDRRIGEAQLQAAFDRLNARRVTAVPPELMGRIAPTRTEGINLRSVFRFPVEAYADRLLPGTSFKATSAMA